MYANYFKKINGQNQKEVAVNAATTFVGNGENHILECLNEAFDGKEGRPEFDFVSYRNDLNNKGIRGNVASEMIAERIVDKLLEASPNEHTVLERLENIQGIGLENLKDAFWDYESAHIGTATVAEPQTLEI